MGKKRRSPKSMKNGKKMEKKQEKNGEWGMSSAGRKKWKKNGGLQQEKKMVKKCGKNYLKMDGF